jgi:hypothetical protein
MESPNHVRLRELIRRLDELCREASEIRIALERAARARRFWPDRRTVSRPFTTASRTDRSGGSDS